MTTIGTANIEFLLSGGTNNSDPKKSTGGSPSSFPILGSMNNLFPDITSEEASSGKVDYRCFYVKNSDSSVTLYDTEVRVSAQNSGGSYVELGVAKSTDVQRIDVTGTSISGTAVFRLGSSPVSVNWGTSPFGFEASLRNALLYAGFAAQVSHSVSGNTTAFTVTFSGVNNNRSWPTLQVQENNLTGTDTPTITIRKISDGRPINSSAPSIATDQMPPSGVSFQSGSILVGRMGPGDFAPVWARRTTPANTQFSVNDGFTVKFSGKPFLQAQSSSSSSSSQTLNIQYSLQPQQTFYSQLFSNNELRIGAQVVITGSSTNSPAVLWEFSSNGGSTWLEVIPTPSMSAVISSVTPGTINETLILLDIGPSMNGWKFRVTNTEGSVSVTSNAFTLQYPLASSSSSSSSIDCTGLPFATASCPNLGIPGISYCSYNESYYPNGCVALKGCGVVVNGNCMPLSQYLNLMSSSSSSPIDCFGLPLAMAFCFDLGIPGISYCSYNSSYHPNGCVASKGCGIVVEGNCIPFDQYISLMSSSSSSSACHFLECGAITPPFAYADCGLFYEPGYIYQMDCNICKCVKSPA